MGDVSGDFSKLGVAPKFQRWWACSDRIQAEDGRAIDPVLFTFAVVATIVTLGLLVVHARAELRARDAKRASPTPATDPAAREAIAHVGNALAATHDASGLLPVILDATVEATGAAGGRVLDDDRELARVGEAVGEQPIELDLGESPSGGEMRLLVDPPHGGLSPESSALAEWLASQASIALENARLHQVVREQAVTDELTGLVNRRRFLEALDAEIARADRLGAPLSLLYADLDDFKRVNDCCGHPAGDEVLRTFAELLRSHLRGIDTAARMGGEEFAVLLPGTELDGAVGVAERIREQLAEQELMREEIGSGLTTSIGVVQHESGSSDDLIRRADAALYSAKEQGKNRVAGEVAA
jgi:diguanylate cyclase (GGDEF)-like protein